jgi:L-threonylcarbamoyladenylate synthase
VSLTPKDAMRLEECLAGDGVAVIPTDTVYGLACNPESESAVRRVYELKQRPPAKPAAVMFFALEPALESLTELGVRTAAAALLPGAVTLLLANPGQRFSLVCDPLGTTRPALLGLRVPALSGPLAALAAVGLPAAQSSANFSGEPDPKRLADVPVELREGADLVLDGGELPGVPSTVVDLSEYEERGEWRVVREGPLTRAEVELILASC